MLNFKPIEDFTFDDCVNSIERLTAQGQPQGYDESLYLCIKMVNENTNQVWYRDYARISGHMSKYESGHTFYIGPSYWHNKLGDNTVYIYISRHSDGSSPICSYSDTYTITRSR